MPPNSSIPIFIINLDSRSDRLKKISSRLGNLPFIRIAAINGQNLDEQEHLKRTVKDRMSKNEIACILSHRLVWQKMADEKMSYACVLEDDAVLSSSFPHYINNSEWLPENFKVISQRCGLGCVQKKKSTSFRNCGVKQKDLLCNC